MAKGIKKKQQLIDKANQTMVATMAITGFLVVFSLVASRSLLGQRSYNIKVITEKEKAVKQLNQNIESVDKLRVAYKAFVETPDNVLGGNPMGTGDRDGDNGKIVLDALPSKYDFPALTTSVQKLLSQQNFKLDSVGGTDDEVNQAKNNSDKPVEMPFEFESTVGNYAGVEGLLTTLERSIRPIQLSTLDLSGGDNNIKISASAKTYYQAARGLKIDKKVVK